MRNLRVASVGALLTGFALLFTPTAAHAADIETNKGIKYGGFEYPDFSGVYLSLAAWMNIDYTNQFVRAYGYTDAPNISGFRSSNKICLSDVLNYGVSNCGNYMYGNQERVTNSSGLVYCGGGIYVVTRNYWETVDAYDQYYSGVFESHHVQSTCRR